ncbi:thiamine-phosphate kinase [Rubinisphaera sp. ICM_H10]|nr:thiamine-phosphate kinase [Rubinisphaera margarita]
MTTDLLLDGVHFRTGINPAADIARKALAVNVSDIAAMAAIPVAAFISIVFPRSWSRQQAEELLQALADSAREFQIAIAGGDTNTWSGGLAINVTLYGQVPKGKAVRRDGAQPGDAICVTGPLGGSFAEKQFRFTPRVQEAIWLRENADLHALIDLSDGISSDLGHILRASGVGAELDAELIPIAPAAQVGESDRTPLERALSDGEDFELLFTLPPDDVERLRKIPEAPVTIFPIGRIIPGQGCVLLDAAGKRTECIASGFVHGFDASGQN